MFLLQVRNSKVLTSVSVQSNQIFYFPPPKLLYGARKPYVAKHEQNNKGIEKNPGVSQEIVNHWLRIPALLCLLLTAVNVVLRGSIKDIKETLHVIAHLKDTG